MQERDEGVWLTFRIACQGECASVGRESQSFVVFFRHRDGLLYVPGGGIAQVESGPGDIERRQMLAYGAESVRLGDIVESIQFLTCLSIPDDQLFFRAVQITRQPLSL